MVCLTPPAGKNRLTDFGTAGRRVNLGALKAAAELYAQGLGWSVFPIAAGSKKPLAPWRGRRYSPSELRRLLTRDADRVGGLAVVCGTASGCRGACLAVRDWDRSDGYPLWAAEHPDLAEALPASRTGRGHHLFFRTTEERFAGLGDGEFRATSGHFVLLPPSLHPSGATYEWLRPPIAPLPVVENPIAVGLLPAPPVPPVPSYPSLFYDCAPLLTNRTAYVDEGRAAEAAVLASLPAAPGQRNLLLFRLARAVKSLPRYAGGPAEEALPLVRRWHELAVGTPMRTKAWAESWADFRRSWECVRQPGTGTISLQELGRWAFELVPLATDRGSRVRGDLLRLSLICERLQGWAGGRPFPLAVRVAADLLGCGVGSAQRFIRQLVNAGELRVATAASHTKRQATEFTYHGPATYAEEKRA
jgi:hypothetical protein